MNHKRIIEYSTLLEVASLAIGAILFCAKIFNFDPLTVLSGGEYILLIETHFIWQLLPECGTCVFWNGFMNGGMPAFAEIHNAPLHPFVAIPAIFWGAVDGSKITFVLSLFTAGYAQWRLSKSMGLKTIPRLWAGFMVMFGGQLCGKMEYGNVGLVLSTACSFLVASELYNFAFREYPRKNLIKLAIFLSLCLLSGQGYFQLVIFVIIIPLTVLFAYRKIGIQAIRNMGEAVGLMILFCGFFLLPLLRFYPNIVKEWDPFFNSLQPLGYSVLNLVIKDRAFFWTTYLGMSNLQFAYYVYIGWIPVLFAVYGAYRGYQTPERRLETIWLIISFFIIYIVTCEEVLLPLSLRFNFLAKIRFAPIMTGYVILPLISLAALGFNALYSLPFNNYLFWKSREDQEAIHVPLTQIVLILISLFALFDVSKSSREFISTIKLDDPGDAFREYFISDTVRWVEPMNGAFYPYLFDHHGKVTNVVHGGSRIILNQPLT